MWSIYNVIIFIAEESECKNNNGGCSHLCLPVPNVIGSGVTKKVECACPDNMVLKTSSECIDGKILYFYSINYQWLP